MDLLLAVDGSEQSDAALTLLEACGRRDDLRVAVLSVAALASATPNWPPDYLKAAVAENVEAAQRTAAEAAERLTGSGFATTVLTGRGHPGACIERTVENRGAALVMLGSGTHRWAGSRLLGSTGSYVLHGAPTSVLVVHSPPASTGQCRILLATDGSPGAHVAAGVLHGFADPNRCFVEVISASPLPETWAAASDSGLTHAYLAHPYVTSSLTPESYQDLVSAERRHTEAIAAQAAERLSHAGFSTQIRTAFGPVKASLLSEIIDGHFDLAVVGSRGLGPLRRVLVGSVSEAVANHAPATLVGRELADAGIP